jgi:hypothetical protein
MEFDISRFAKFCLRGGCQAMDGKLQNISIKQVCNITAISAATVCK